MREDFRLPDTPIAVMLLLVCGVCVLMLNLRIRAREVVRG
jgi:hypothetical protein